MTDELGNAIMAALPKFKQVAILALGCTKEMAEAAVATELQFYLSRLSAIDLAKHQLPLDRGKTIFLEVLMAGLSFSPGSRHVYLLPSYHNSTQLTYEVSPYGRIYMCQKAESVDYVTKPVIVYEGDSFRVGTNEQGHQVVLHAALQHPGNKPPIVGGYVFVVTPGGARESYWMDKADVERLRAKSRKNPLYSNFNGDIDPGFFGGKLIKHALATYRTKSIVPPAADEDEDAKESVETPAPVQVPPQNQNNLIF
ncbi:MAG: recombinase RecT [Edaphocola sp.]